ncbi:MAG: transposase [Acidobacteriia bacterium]|nr:transposase [Terriglobia bacterium]
MAIPYRGNTGLGTYFITASTAGKRSLFQTERMSRLFIEVLLHYRAQARYGLHEFVLMPNHFHLLITPAESLERSLQLIKGGFSFRARKELGFVGEIWQGSFYDHSVRDVRDYDRCRDYILNNPVKRGLVASPDDYPYGSAAGFVLDKVPQRLKPILVPA